MSELFIFNNEAIKIRQFGISLGRYKTDQPARYTFYLAVEVKGIK